MYNVKTRIEVVRQDTTFNDKIYGGWLAVNTGTQNATVLQLPLAPGEKLDFTRLHPDVTWEQPIQILPGSGGEVTLIRLLYNQK